MTMQDNTGSGIEETLQERAQRAIAAAFVRARTTPVENLPPRPSEVTADSEWLTTASATVALNALRDCGFQLVELPEPHTRHSATDEENGSAQWSGLRDADGVLIVDGPITFDDGEVHVNGSACDAADVAAFAAKLLAATAREGVR